MEARSISAALVIVASSFSLGASHRTQNFIVTASSPQVSAAVAQAAEHFRKQLAIEWLGRELPPWRQPCPIEVHVGPQYGAGGATSFRFDGREPTAWTMTIHGSYQRVLDSVLPHEITHTIFATHFGRPLPRWADEGACTTVEHISERSKQQQLLIRFLSSERGIPFNSMFTMTEYPQDMIPLYSQGHSVARYLIMHGGKRKFIEYVWDGMGLNNPKHARMHYTQKLSNQEMIRLWTEATNKHYGFENLSELQVTWLGWVKQGRPEIQNEPRTLLVSSTQSAAVGNQVADFDPTKESRTESLAANAVSPHKTPASSNGSLSTDGASEGGWYQRHAKQVQAGNSEALAQSEAEALAQSEAPPEESLPVPYQPGSIRGAPTVLHGRPQPSRQARQQIIEWGRGAVAPPARTSAGKPTQLGAATRWR